MVNLLTANVYKMLRIVKIGGNIVDNEAKLRAFLTDFAAMEGPKILIHGGGKVATAIAAALGIETRMVEGRRVTDARTLEVVTMVYNGVNKQIVSILQGLGCDAVGLCGADGKLIVSHRRPPVMVGGDGGKTGGTLVDYGLVGDPVSVNNALVNKLINSGLTLVVAPITLDERAGETASATDTGGVGCSACTADTGGLLNTNADTVASALATSLAASLANEDKSVELVYCFEKQGVMMDVDNPDSVIPLIDRAKFADLRTAGIVDRGMIPKLENAFRALESGVAKVVICAAENLSRTGYGGTTIKI